MSGHPLLGALLAVDCCSRDLMRHAGSTRQREDLRDALADLRRTALHTIALQAGAGSIAMLDAATFKAIVRRHRELGLGWQEMVDAFNEVREGGE